MSERTRRILSSNYENFYDNSKYTDMICSDSSVKSLPLKDNTMLTNKRLFIHYVKEKRDVPLEVALRKLNAIILEFFDETVNFVITDFKRKFSSNVWKVQAVDNSSKVQSKLNGLRSSKLVDMIQQKSFLNDSKGKNTDSDKSVDFLEQVTRKGIRVMDIHTVRNWLLKHHAMLLEEEDDEEDEENETQDATNKIRKLVAPSLKITDTKNQTRPSYHQNCVLSKDLFEETYSVIVDCKSEQSNRLMQSKPSESVKSVSARRSRSKVKKMKNNTKSEAGYCECCNSNYVNLINHLVSPGHLEYATNDQNYEGIDQVIDNISILAPFLAIRIKKQTIIERKVTNRKLIKSVSANDFKNDEIDQVSQKSSICKNISSYDVEKVADLVFVDDLLEEVSPLFTEIFEECVATVIKVSDQRWCVAVQQEVLVKESVGIIESLDEYCVALEVLHGEEVIEWYNMLQELSVEEDCESIDDEEDYWRACETVQEDVMRTAVVVRRECWCVSQEVRNMKAEEVLMVAEDGCGQRKEEVRRERLLMAVSSTDHLLRPGDRDYQSPHVALSSTTVWQSQVSESSLDDDDEDHDHDQDHDSSQLSVNYCPVNDSFTSPIIHHSMPRSPQPARNPYSPYLLHCLSRPPLCPYLSPNSTFHGPPPLQQQHHLSPSFDSSYDLPSPTQYHPVCDTIVDLTQYLTRTEQPYFDSLSFASLRRKPARPLHLDNVVSSLFIRQYHIDLSDSPPPPLEQVSTDNVTIN